MNKSQWNAFVLASSPSALFQSWDWGEVAKKLGHKIWRLEWPEGVAQVERIQAKRGTFLHVRHGPIVTKNWKKVTDSLIKLAKEEHALFVRVSPQITDSRENTEMLKRLGFVSAPIHAMDAELCWVLDLTPSEDELLGAMRKSTRYEIKHSQGVRIEKSRDIERFLRLYNLTSKRHHFVRHIGIKEEFELLDTTLYLASYQSKDIASALIVYFGNEAIYRHGASIPSKIPASYALQWEAIKEAKRRGKKLYNFWGIAPQDKPNHPWQGITLFKKGFGGRENRYIHAHDLPVSPLYAIPRTIELARKVLKGY